MNEKNTNHDAYEKYAGATVGLLMENYADVLSENLLGEMENCKKDNTDFPQELDKQCLALIKKECARHQRKQCLKTFSKGLQYAAVLVICLFATATTLFVSVEAIRIPIINYFIEKGDGYWEFSSDVNSASNIPSDVIDVTDPLKGLIPSEYKLTLLDGDSLDFLFAIYSADPDKEISFSSQGISSTVQIDAEDADKSQKFEILGNQAVLILKDRAVRLGWVQENKSTIFTLMANDLSEDTVIQIAKQIIQKIS